MTQVAKRGRRNPHPAAPQDATGENPPLPSRKTRPVKILTPPSSQNLTDRASAGSPRSAGLRIIIPQNRRLVNRNLQDSPQNLAKFSLPVPRSPACEDSNHWRRPWMAPPDKVPTMGEDLGGVGLPRRGPPSKPPPARPSPAQAPPIFASCIANTVCPGARAGEFLLGADGTINNEQLAVSSGQWPVKSKGNS